MTVCFVFLILCTVPPRKCSSLYVCLFLLGYSWFTVLCEFQACSKVIQLHTCVYIYNPMDSSPLTQGWTCVSCISCVAGGFFTAEPPGKPYIYTHTYTPFQVLCHIGYYKILIIVLCPMFWFFFGASQIWLLMKVPADMGQHSVFSFCVFRLM